MTSSHDQELRAWIDEWQADQLPPLAVDTLAARVRRRARTLKIWAVSEAVVGASALAVVSYRAVVDPDPLEKLAMSLLAAIAIGALAFSWWSWRGIFRASGESTTAFLEYSVQQTRRWQRYLRTGWLILVAEVAVFVPWIQHRLAQTDEAARPGAAAFAWGLLTLMVTLAIVWMSVAQRYLRREMEQLAALREEIRRD
jgi:hypothetical protein